MYTIKCNVYNTLFLHIFNYRVSFSLYESSIFSVAFMSASVNVWFHLVILDSHKQLWHFTIL